ncbi:MAG: hypothetical protein GX221_06180 [Candidatus Riflebacteria bacterium]|nr:hypothetical protein [Candidatus Riflebacteria bacterium]
MTVKIKSFSELLFQKEAAEHLSRSLNQKSFPSCYLFTGTESCGKVAAAELFAGILQCLEPKTDVEGNMSMCGICDSCRRMQRNSHPDVEKIFSPDREIRVAKARFIRDAAMIAPILSRYKIFILDPAQNLNQEASNALLKILEEAPSYVIFILTAYDKTSVLPTVASRAEIVQFNSPSYQEIRELLQNIYKLSSNSAADICSLGEGRLGRSLACAEEDFSIDKVDGISRAHAEYLLALEQFFIFASDELQELRNLDLIAETLRRLFDRPNNLLEPARKKFAFSLFVANMLPLSFAPLFADEFMAIAQSGQFSMNKALKSLMDEAAKSYPSALLKEIKEDIEFRIDRFGIGEIKRLAHVLAGFYSDSIIYSASEDEDLLLNKNFKEDIIKMPQYESFVLSEFKLEATENCLLMLERNVQPVLALENLITQIGGPAV